MIRLEIDITYGTHEKLQKVTDMRNELHRQWKEQEHATVENTAEMAIDYGAAELARTHKRDPRSENWTTEMVAGEALAIGVKHLEKVYGYECRPEE